MLSLTSPQLIPGTLLSPCICFSCRLKSPEAAEPAMGRSACDELEGGGGEGRAGTRIVSYGTVLGVDCVGRGWW